MPRNFAEVGWGIGSISTTMMDTCSYISGALGGMGYKLHHWPEWWDSDVQSRSRVYNDIGHADSRFIEKRLPVMRDLISLIADNPATVVVTIKGEEKPMPLIADGRVRHKSDMFTAGLMLKTKTWDLLDVAEWLVHRGHSHTRFGKCICYDRIINWQQDSS